jgi:hypothetical protein
MHYSKKDMEFTHYRWIEEGDTSSLYAGEPSRRIFDPHNGDQVLFLINYYLSTKGNYSVTEGRAIESKLAHNLPISSQSERSVFNWLRDQVTA